MSGQGTSLALIGAFLLAHAITTSPDLPTAFGVWEPGFRANVEQNQRLATDGMATLLPASRVGIFARNQSMRVLPILAAVRPRFRRPDRTGFACGHPARFLTAVAVTTSFVHARPARTRSNCATVAERTLGADVVSRRRDEYAVQGAGHAAERVGQPVGRLGAR